MEFSYDVDGKLREIFEDHCNLSAEQYREIRRRLIELVDGYREIAPQAELEEEAGKLKMIFEFLLNTHEITLKEHYELENMVDNIEQEALKVVAAKSYGQLMEMLKPQKQAMIL